VESSAEQAVALLGGGLQAQATGASSSPGAHDVHTTEVAGSGEASTLSYNFACFGYTGTFKDGSEVMIVGWSTTQAECFGVAPDRTVWHVWPASGGWKLMPGNGRADDTGTIWIENTATGARTFAVRVEACQGCDQAERVRSG
jgi:hypothetical protein